MDDGPPPRARLLRAASKTTPTPEFIFYDTELDADGVKNPTENRRAPGGCWQHADLEARKNALGKCPEGVPVMTGLALELWILGGGKSRNSKGHSEHR